MQYVGAYLVRGDVAIVETLINRLEKDGVIRRGSPDLFARVYRKFGVDEAQELRERARTKPILEERRVFVFFAASMTNESQNALLKTLEEPAAGALFFLVTPSPEVLLPTVRSRTQSLVIADNSDGSVEDFLHATPEKRLEMVKPLYDHDEDEGRDMGRVIAFLQALERRWAKEKESHGRTEALRALYRARMYAGDKGSLLKVLLEQMALLMPRI